MNEPYFAQRLLKRLESMRTASAIVLDAPSGYGKTTLARHFAERFIPRGTRRLWHSCLEESPAKGWKRFCLAFRQACPPEGDRLLRLGLPDDDTRGEAAAILREAHSDRASWLVVDDFQHLKDAVSRTVWDALLDPRPWGPRVVLASRNFRGLRLATRPELAVVGAEDLLLREEEIGEFFAAAGTPLSDRDRFEAFSLTGGWMLLLRLQLLHYRETGDFKPAPGIRRLIREIVWDRLGEDERDLLLRLSPFDGWTAPQAAFCLELPEFPAFAERMEDNPFIRFEADGGWFRPHDALLEFTRGVFSGLAEDRRRGILRRAAAWRLEAGDREGAVAFLHRLRDFEAILSIDLSGLEADGVDFGDAGYGRALLDAAAAATPAMLARHPLSAIKIAFDLFARGRMEEMAGLCARAEPAISRSGRPLNEKGRLLGELTLLKSFAQYNDIAGMARLIRKAARLLDGKPSLVHLSNSWTFGNASVLCMYHANPGRLDRELADMESGLAAYSALTGGHGEGGDVLMRAEAAFNRGEVVDAAVLAHRAARRAGAKRQDCVAIGADLLLGRLALFKGDGGALAAALESLGSVAGGGAKKHDRLEADLARAFLMALLERPDDLAEWLRRGEAEKRLFAAAAPYAHVLHGKYLLLAGQPERWLGLAEDALRLADGLHSLMAVIYHRLHSAAALEMLGRRDLAAGEFGLALGLALPDRLYLPFAENLPALGRLLRAVSPPEAREEIMRLGEIQAAGKRAVLLSLFAGAPPFGLTRREYEAAGLAAEGFSNQEIAERLFLSVNTVKTHLKTAYRKTGVSSRPALRKLLRR